MLSSNAFRGSALRSPYSRSSIGVRQRMCLSAIAHPSCDFGPRADVRMICDTNFTDYQPTGRIEALLQCTKGHRGIRISNWLSAGQFLADLSSLQTWHLRSRIQLQIPKLMQGCSGSIGVKKHSGTSNAVTASKPSTDKIPQHVITDVRRVVLQKRSCTWQTLSYKGINNV